VSPETRAELKGERLPEIPFSERLVDYWRELGYAMDGPAGPVPFTWGEVAAFASVGGYDIIPVEARVLVNMSRAYVDAMNDTAPLSKAPMDRTGDG
jgi:hypothetical protein